MKLHDILLIVGAALGLVGVITVWLGLLSTDIGLAIIGIKAIQYAAPLASIGIILMVVHSILGRR